jgi:thiosulfate/3-mercaptopyruvate sulfurtransferase
MAVTAPLVGTAWLADRLDRADLVVIDASWFMPGSERHPKAEFAERHIPGAVFFGIDEISDHASDLPHMLPAPGDFGTAVRRLGVNSDSDVIVYDTHGLFSAARAWWSFRAMGHTACAVLDGGLPRWMAEGRPLESGWPNPRHGDFRAHPRPELLADLAAMLGHIEHGDAQILDARSPSRFAGATPEPRAGLRAGHMPGARNVPWTALVSGDALVDPAGLRAALAAADVDLNRPIVTTCGSGITAALLALGLASLGREDVAVYDGSWSEWGARNDTPIATGAA